MAQDLAPVSSDELAGDITPLAQAIGGPEALASLSALAELIDLPRPESAASLGAFLVRYRERFLTSIELPAVCQAYFHAERGEYRQLVALDQRLAARFGDSAFADASRFTGRLQLRRLRPLRNATLQRYLRAVESGEATGWHVIVFGLLLALFSLPLRQGLVHFAIRTQHSLIDSAVMGGVLTSTQVVALRKESETNLGFMIQEILPPFDPALATTPTARRN
jgi:urease accessory protein UreF